MTTRTPAQSAADNVRAWVATDLLTRGQEVTEEALITGVAETKVRWLEKLRIANAIYAVLTVMLTVGPIFVALSWWLPFSSGFPAVVGILVSAIIVALVGGGSLLATVALLSVMLRRVSLHTARNEAAKSSVEIATVDATLILGDLRNLEDPQSVIDRMLYRTSSTVQS